MSSRGPADGYQNFRRSRSRVVRKSTPENEYDRAFVRATGMLPFVSAGDRDRRAPAAGPWVTMHKALFCLLRRFSARCTKLQAETQRRFSVCCTRRPKAQEAEGAGGGDLRSSDADRCCICLTNPKTHAIQPCGHRCLCPTCVSTVENRGKCPLCRGNVEAVLRIYH